MPECFRQTSEAGKPRRKAPMIFFLRQYGYLVSTLMLLAISFQE